MQDLLGLHVDVPMQSQESQVLAMTKIRRQFLQHVFILKIERAPGYTSIFSTSWVVTMPAQDYGKQ